MRFADLPRPGYPGGWLRRAMSGGAPEVDPESMGTLLRTARRTALATSFALVLGIAPSLASAAVTPALETRLATTTAAQRVPVIVTLKDQVDAARFAGHPTALLAALHREARRTAHQLPLDGPQRVRHFWLVNALALSADPAQIARFAGDPHVASVDLDTRVDRGRRRRPGHPAEDVAARATGGSTRRARARSGTRTTSPARACGSA